MRSLIRFEKSSDKESEGATQVEMYKTRMKHLYFFNLCTISLLTFCVPTSTSVLQVHRRGGDVDGRLSAEALAVSHLLPPPLHRQQPGKPQAQRAGARLHGSEQGSRPNRYLCTSCPFAQVSSLIITALAELRCG